MKSSLKNKLFTESGKKLIASLTTWSLLFLAVLAVCPVTGCRLFTIGG